MANSIAFEEWQISLAQSDMLLKDAKASLKHVGYGPAEIPLIIRIMENPKFNIAGKTMFHGAVTLEQHDYIHIILGRGLLAKDEAFTVGFTMGSTGKVSTTEENLFAMIAQNFYPDEYRFHKDDAEIFHDAVKLANISRCESLVDVDFSTYADLPISAVRTVLGIEESLLRCYYQLEQTRYPQSMESQRLLS